MTELPFKPVIILGAGRSGTNMLRDVLTAITDIATWPCDEIQPIWRHGNLGFDTDQFTADMATPKVRTFIRRAFVKEWKARGRPSFLVEKTCANTLRVPFLAALFPEAHFVTITRHGEDVVPSAVARWQGRLEVPPLSYFAAKARYIPMSDVHIYAKGFISNRIDKMRGKSQRLRTWGPIWDGLKDIQGAPLDEICAHQWVACVQATQEDLTALSLPVTTTRYEDFLGDPEGETRKILDAIGHNGSRVDLAQATATVRRKTVGTGPRAGTSSAVRAILDAQCRVHGYGVN